MDVDQLEVIHLAEENRFEIRVDGYTAELTYSLIGSIILFTHTGVPPALEGQGVGTKLVKAGLEYARENRFKIQSICSFVTRYLQRHPEYQA
ncbi:MAG: N-acetyltransferase [Anaerolineaceae bacterium]|nr:MAG: N-acetyltransferase [Anaerolineaceae bacterium]